MYTIVCIYEDLPCRELLAEYLASLDIPAASQPHEGGIVFNIITAVMMATPTTITITCINTTTFIMSTLITTSTNDGRP